MNTATTSRRILPARRDQVAQKVSILGQPRRTVYLSTHADDKPFGHALPMRAIRGVTKTAPDGRVLAGWTVLEHGFDGGLLDDH